MPLPVGKMDKKKTYRPDQNGPERGLYAHNKAVLIKTATVCALCGLPLDKTIKYPHPMSISIDHIIPVALGGKSTIDNLQATHRTCNRQKGTKLIAPPCMGSDSNENKKNNFKTNLKVESEKIPQYIDWKNYSCD